MALICIFLMISDVEHLFMTCWPSVCLLWKNVHSDPLPIFKLDFFFMLCCLSSLYILNINLWLAEWFENIFSYSVGYLFILLVISFAVQKILSLKESQVFIFDFVPFSFGISYKNLSPRSILGACHLCFLLGILWFQVLHSSL